MSCDNTELSEKRKRDSLLTSSEYKSWLKRNSIDTDKSDHTDSIQGSLYRNLKYKFRIRFPEAWSIVKGDGTANIIKAIQQDSGITYLVSVVEVKGQSIKPLPDLAKDEEAYKEFIKALLKEQNIESVDLRMEKYFLNNFPAVLSEFKIVNKTRDLEVEYLIKQVQCVYDGKIYGLTLSMPSVFHTEAESARFDAIVDSFVFEITI
jgi:hypothetical protein